MNVLGICLYKGSSFYMFENILNHLRIMQEVDSEYLHGISAAVAALIG